MKRIFLFIIIHIMIVNVMLGQYCEVSGDPRLNARYAANTNQRTSCAGTGTIIVKLKPTIIRRSNGTGGITIDQLEWILNDLREDFLHTNIEFAFCGPRILNDDFLFNNFYNDEPDDEFGDTDDDDPDLVLQNYLTSDMIDLFFVDSLIPPGAASLPHHKDLNQVDNIRDWVVIRNNAVLQDGLIAHELGHYLGLLHTHEHTYTRHDLVSDNHIGASTETVDGVNCASTGDGICDTPADPGLYHNEWDPMQGCSYTGMYDHDLNSATPEILMLDENGQSYNPLTNNFMSYAPGDCLNSFTLMQIERMRCNLNSTQVSLGRNYVVGGATACNCTSPLSDISWVSFSDDNQVVNCNETIYVLANLDGNQIISANQKIIAQNTIGSNATVDYKAGGTIYLKEGFKVELGATFKTKTESCTPTQCSGSSLVQEDNDLSSTNKNTVIQEVLSTDQIEQKASLVCYPNPANNHLNIDFSLTQPQEKLSVQLIDVHGRAVVSLQENNLQEGLQKYQVNTQVLPNGVYLVLVASADFQYTQRVLVSH